MFERGVSAREFATTTVNVFDETIEGNVIDHYRKQSIACSEKEVR
jgi:MFS transporter, SP family, general alpha glucoside:H+ symporter